MAAGGAALLAMSRIFGIDLGTTNSLIAVMEGERPQIAPDPKTANPLLPSVVAITPQGEVIVGEQRDRDGTASHG